MFIRGAGHVAMTAFVQSPTDRAASVPHSLTRRVCCRAVFPSQRKHTHAVDFQRPSPVREISKPTRRRACRYRCVKPLALEAFRQETRARDPGPDPDYPFVHHEQTNLPVGSSLIRPLLPTDQTDPLRPPRPLQPLPPRQRQQTLPAPASPAAGAAQTRRGPRRQLRAQRRTRLLLSPRAIRRVLLTGQLPGQPPRRRRARRARPARRDGQHAGVLGPARERRQRRRDAGLGREWFVGALARGAWRHVLRPRRRGGPDVLRPGGGCGGRGRGRAAARGGDDGRGLDSRGRGAGRGRRGARGAVREGRGRDGRRAGAAGPAVRIDGGPRLGVGAGGGGGARVRREVLVVDLGAGVPAGAPVEGGRRARDCGPRAGRRGGGAWDGGAGVGASGGAGRGGGEAGKGGRGVGRAFRGWVVVVRGGGRGDVAPGRRRARGRERAHAAAAAGRLRLGRGEDVRALAAVEGVVGDGGDGGAAGGLGRALGRRQRVGDDGGDGVAQLLAGPAASAVERGVGLRDARLERRPARPHVGVDAQDLAVERRAVPDPALDDLQHLLDGRAVVALLGLVLVDLLGQQRRVGPARALAVQRLVQLRDALLHRLAHLLGLPARRAEDEHPAVLAQLLAQRLRILLQRPVRLLQLQPPRLELLAGRRQDVLRSLLKGVETHG